MNSEWKLTTLGEFCPFFYGKALPERKRKSGIVPVISSAGIVGYHDEALVKTGGIVIGRKGTIGSVTLSKKPFWAIDTAFFIVDKPEQRDLFFTYYLLKTLNLSTMNSDSAVPGLNRENAHNLSVNIPPLHLQYKISNLLTILDDRIHLLRETNATLESIAQALFKSWFVDFDPVRAKAEGRTPEGIDAETAALFPDSFEKSELGLVPRGWKSVSLREVVTIFDSQRIPLSSQERKKRKGLFPYYGAAALMDHINDYIFDGVYLLLGEDGSVINPDGSPVTQYVWGKMWVNNHAHVLQGANSISTEHLLLAIKNINIRPYVTGAVQAKLSQTNMWRIPFLMPSKLVAENFNKAISIFFEKIRYNSEHLRTLIDLRDMLLPRLISGQLRLPEAKSIIENAL